MPISNKRLAKYIFLLLALLCMPIIVFVAIYIYVNSGYEAKLPEAIHMEGNTTKKIHLHAERTKMTLALTAFKFELSPSNWINVDNISLTQRMGCCGLGQMYMSFEISPNYNNKQKIKPEAVRLKFSVVGHELADTAKLHWADSTIIYLN